MYLSCDRKTKSAWNTFKEDRQDFAPKSLHSYWGRQPPNIITKTNKIFSHNNIRSVGNKESCEIRVLEVHI